MLQFLRLRRHSLIAVGLACLGGLSGCVRPAARSDVARRAARPIRAIWITRWDYRSAEDVKRVVASSADLGFNLLLFQVRGNGTAFYRSSLEPWADELTGMDPGYDPLAVACAEAHRRGVELHAWINVMPAWRGKAPPTNPQQLYLRRPEWCWYDQHGARQRLSDFYVSLNPCLPEVRSYLVGVCREIVDRYDVDGLHLDYIRFPNEPPATPAGSGLDYPRDPRTMTLFRTETGRRPDSSPAAWDAWRTECVTRLVRAIREMIDEEKASVMLSAAVGAAPDRALRHFQDGMGWAREGLIDAVFPMNYTDDPALFAARLQPWQAEPLRARLVPGIRVGKDDDAAARDMGDGELALREQVKTALQRCDAFAVFAYASLFDDPAETADNRAGRRALRARRREMFRTLTSTVGSPIAWVSAEARD